VPAGSVRSAIRSAETATVRAAVLHVLRVHMTYPPTQVSLFFLQGANALPVPTAAVRGAAYAPSGSRSLVAHGGPAESRSPASSPANMYKTMANHRVIHGPLPDANLGLTLGYQGAIPTARKIEAGRALRRVSMALASTVSARWPRPFIRDCCLVPSCRSSVP